MAAYVRYCWKAGYSLNVLPRATDDLKNLLMKLTTKDDKNFGSLNAR